MARERYHHKPGGAETTVRVRYAETDAQGIVYSSHYLIWFEIARTEWCRQAGINYRDVESQGYLLVVTDARCRYLAPAHYDDEVAIQTWVARANRRQLQFHYALRLIGAGTQIATGETTHLWVDRAGKPVTLPSALYRFFEEGAARPAT